MKKHTDDKIQVAPNSCFSLPSCALYKYSERQTNFKATKENLSRQLGKAAIWILQLLLAIYNYTTWIPAASD
jgi:hypothetical protein